MAETTPQPSYNERLNPDLNPVILFLLKIPGFRELILSESIGNKGWVYRLKQIPGYEPKFKEGQLVRYISKYGALLSCDPDEDLEYQGYKIENNTEKTNSPLGKYAGWVGFGYLKEKKLVGKVLRYSLNVPHWIKPKYVVEFTVPFESSDGLSLISKVKVVLYEDDLEEVSQKRF